MRLSADSATKTQEVAVGILDGELTETVRKILRTPFGLTVLFNSVPQCINVIDSEVLGRRCVRLSEMRIVHKHDGDAIAAQATPSICLRPGALKSQNSLIPSDRPSHIFGLEHRHQFPKRGHESLHGVFERTRR